MGRSPMLVKVNKHKCEALVLCLINPRGEAPCRLILSNKGLLCSPVVTNKC